MEPFHAIYYPNQGDDDVYEGILTDVEQEAPPKKKRRTTMPLQREDTLTQLGYMSTSIQVHEEPDVLQPMEDSYVLGASSSRTKRRDKRRKTTPGAPAHTVQARNSRRQAVEKGIEDEEDVSENAVRENAVKPQAAALMPPPKTPKSSRRKEIPSSQSPADTPLSTQSRRSWREISRSPLKEKSTNTPTHNSSSRKNARKVPRLVVADTMDGTNTDTSTSTQAGFRNPLAATNCESPVETANRSRGGFAVMDHDIAYVPSKKTDQRSYSTRKQAEIANSEIMDTDSETSDESLEDSRFDFSLQIQPVRATADLPEPGEQVKRAVDRNGYQGQIQNGNSSDKAFVPIARDSDDETAPTKDLVSEPQKPEESLSHDYPHFRSDSEEASAQLTAEFIRTTQPAPLVETESQWESTWRACSGPNDPEDYDPQIQEISSSPASEKISAVITPSAPRSRPPLTSSPARPPPSQATTVDITQPSFHLPLSSAQRPQPTLSSPPSLPPLFVSSPLRTRKHGDAYMGYVGGWNGERLTDSQLLPDSLMNDSMPAPPSPLLFEDAWDNRDD